MKQIHEIEDRRRGPSTQTQYTSKMSKHTSIQRLTIHHMK